MYQKENLQNQTKDTAIDDLEMYSVPGHRELGPKDFARYQQSQKQDHFINELSVRTQEEFSLLLKKTNIQLF